MKRVQIPITDDDLSLIVHCLVTRKAECERIIDALVSDDNITSVAMYVKERDRYEEECFKISLLLKGLMKNAILR